MSESEWDIDDYREKLYPQRGEKLLDSFAASGRSDIQDIDVTDELLHESYVFMAEIVKTYGEQFFPIFERLHLEIEIRAEKRSLLDTATELSKTNGPVQS